MLIKRKVFLCVFFSLSCPLSAEQETYTILAPTYNAGHVDLGIAKKDDEHPFYPSRAYTSNGVKLTTDMFDKPEVCGGCHTEIYAQWKGSMHSNAWQDPVYRGILKLASQQTGGQVDNLCLGCHTPIGLTTGEASVTGEHVSELSANGVQCDFCHNISGARGVGNASWVLTPKKFGKPLKFGPFYDAQSPYHDTTYSDLHTTSAFCGNCHNVTHPFNNMPIERTYDEWKDSIYATKGIDCQDCHMTPGSGVTKNPGRATPNSKERHIFTHFFVGGNVMVPDKLGSPQHVRQAEEMLKGAAEIEIQQITPSNPKAGDLVKTVVRVTNTGAGHKLPTGFPEGREMWIDFQVKDADEKEIYRLGQIKDGLTEVGTKSFKVLMADDKGKIVDLELWKASKVISDNRLMPMAFVDVEYQFWIPKNAKSPFNIIALLNYWSFPQSLVDHLLGEGTLTVPITKMASVETKLGN